MDQLTHEIKMETLQMAIEYTEKLYAHISIWDQHNEEEKVKIVEQMIEGTVWLVEALSLAIGAYWIEKPAIMTEEKEIIALLKKYVEQREMKQIEDFLKNNFVVKLSQLYSYMIEIENHVKDGPTQLIEKTINLLQNNHSEGLYMLHYVLAMLQEDEKMMEQIRLNQEIFEELESAMLNEDCIQIYDLLKYEIIPLYGHLK